MIIQQLQSFLLIFETIILNGIAMKNLYRHIDLSSVQEWKQFYIDQHLIDSILNVLTKSIHILQSNHTNKQLMDITQYEEVETMQNIQIDLEHQTSHKNQKQIQIHKFRGEVINIFKQSCKCLAASLSKQLSFAHTFIQLRAFKVVSNYNKCVQYVQTIPNGDDNLLTLIENVYVQCYYLKKIITFNIQRYQHIIHHYSLTTKISQLETNNLHSNLIYQMDKMISKIFFELEAMHVVFSSQNIDRNELTLVKHNNSKKGLIFISIFGWWCGLLTGLLLFSLVFAEYQQLHFQANKQFQEQFAIWRGSSYILYYMWCLGIVFALFQLTKINHRFILLKWGFQSKNISQSYNILLTASVLTGIYLTLFILQLMQKSLIIDTHLRYHWGGISWLLIFAYIFNPLHLFNYEGRISVIKLIGSIIICPLTRVTPILIFASEQIVSMGQPIVDLSYTVCTYLHEGDVCKSQAPLVGTIVMCIIFLYRMIENLKTAKQTNAPIWSLAYMGFIRGTLSLVTVVVSYLYRLNNNNTRFGVWVFFASVTTCWAWFVDVKFDWGLLAWQKSQRLLRGRLYFPRMRIMYYILIIINFFGRAAWVVSISTSIPVALRILPFLFVLVMSYIEITRRAIWNFFKLENQHSNNCRNNQPIIDYSVIEGEVGKKYKEIVARVTKKQTDNQQQIGRNKKQKQLLNEQKQKRKITKARTIKWINKSLAELRYCQKSIIDIIHPRN